MNTETSFPGRISAADIIIAPSLPARQYASAQSTPRAAKASGRLKEQRDALYGELRRIIEVCSPKPNRHDLVTALIAVCIDHGIATLPHIIGTLLPLGINKGHIARVLLGESGDDPSRHRWWRDGQGIYGVYPETWKSATATDLAVSPHE